jgi:hypothetical protein
MAVTATETSGTRSSRERSSTTRSSRERSSTTRGWELFAQYAFPPNELGYCGPPDASKLLKSSTQAADARLAPHVRIAEHAQGFEGAWPYLEDIAAAAGVDDPLDFDVVRNYWIGGSLLARVDGERLLNRLRSAFERQPTGLLNELTSPDDVLPHHSFHVFVVYPWIRFLDRDPANPLHILQSCRIRWGTVDSVDGEHAVVVSRPLRFDGALSLGEPMPENVRWSRDGTALAPAPVPGQIVSAHWDWLCGGLTPYERDVLSSTTQRTLDLVNTARG